MSTTPTVHFEAASTLAVVVSSHEPLLFLSDDLKIIAASASFCRAFDIDPTSVPGKKLGVNQHPKFTPYRHPILTPLVV